MDFQEEEPFVHEVISQPVEQLEDPTEEIWIVGDDLYNPELEEPREYELDDQNNQPELHLTKRFEEILNMVDKAPHQKPNPEFQMTIYNYPSSMNLALYDYDRQDVFQASHRFNQSSFAYRSIKKTQNLIMISLVDEVDAQMGILPFENPSAEVIFSIKLEESLYQKGKKFYSIIPEEIAELEDRKHKSQRLDKRIYKSIRQKGKYPDEFSFHKLEKNDEIRFGLQTYRVIEINLDPIGKRKEKLPVSKETFEQQKSGSLSDRLSIPGMPTCKICLSSENIVSDPLITPCKCRGTCSYVHLNCLKTWLNSNLTKETQKLVDSYKWTKMECEICKVTYPLKLPHQGKLLQLADYEAPDEPYVVFERMRSGCRKQILVVKGTEFPVHVGRNMDCDFKILVNTVSRLHAIIEFTGGQFYLKDLASKYGTLVRIKERIRVEGKLKIQVGDQLLRFDLVNKKQGKEYVWKYN